MAICAADEITISGLPLYSSILAANCDYVISQRPQKLFSPNMGNVLRGHEPRENVIRVVAAKVEICVALLGDAYLFDKAATLTLSDVIPCLLRQNGRCLAVSRGHQDDREEQFLLLPRARVKGDRAASSAPRSPPLVGHESAAVSHRYTHVGKEALAKAAKSLPEI